MKEINVFFGTAVDINYQIVLPAISAMLSATVSTIKLGILSAISATIATVSTIKLGILSAMWAMMSTIMSTIMSATVLMILNCPVLVITMCCHIDLFYLPLELYMEPVDKLIHGYKFDQINWERHRRTVELRCAELPQPKESERFIYDYNDPSGLRIQGMVPIGSGFVTSMLANGVPTQGYIVRGTERIPSPSGICPRVILWINPLWYASTNVATTVTSGALPLVLRNYGTKCEVFIIHSNLRDAVDSRNRDTRHGIDYVKD